jgi:hypothetical protein
VRLAVELRVIEVAPLVVAEALAPAEELLGAVAPALAGAVAGAGAAAAGAGAGAVAGSAGGVTAVAPLAAVAGGVAAGVGGAAGVAGVPKPEGVQAQASPVQTTATPSNDKTAMLIMRARASTGPSPL